MSVGKQMNISFDTNNHLSPCTLDGDMPHLRVCFPEIANRLEVSDEIVFDDGKMVAKVLSKGTDGVAIIECTEINTPDRTYSLKGKK